jgi:uncharacterized oxidoreductase
MKLEGKRLLITGGASGIGLELASRLADDSDVVIAGRSTGRLATACQRYPQLGAVQLDVTSEASAANVIDGLANDLAGLDLLVNSAGVMIGGAVTDPSIAATAAEELAVNVEGPIRMTRLALPLLTRSQGTVVFVTSGVAYGALPNLSVYTASKAAMHSFARSLRAELAGTGVRVLEVLPPVVDTGLARELHVPKIPAAAVVDALIGGLRHDREEIAVGRVRAVSILARLAPKRADRILQKALFGASGRPRPFVPIDHGEHRDYPRAS